MLFVELFRYSRGWVRFRASGNFPERFLNLAARQAIATWNTRRMDNCTLSSCTAASNYRKLRPIAKKTGVRLHIIERGGFPFVRNRYRRRTGLVAGVLAFFVFLGVMSGFVWRVDVSGNHRVDTTVVLEELSRLGVHPGIRRSTVDARDVERRMMLRLPDLGWIAVNLQGGVADVRIHERTLPPPVLEKDTPCNLVAAEAGQIVKMEVYEGQPVVKKGYAVERGDVIVSGVIEKADGTVIRLAHARALVLAEVQQTLKVEVPLTQTKTDIVGVQRRYSLSLFGVELPLYLATPMPKPYKLERTQQNLRMLGMDFPLGIVKLQYLLGKEYEVARTSDQALALAEKQLTRLEESTFGELEITHRQPEAQESEQGVTLSCDYRVVKDIVNESEILTK